MDRQKTVSLYDAKTHLSALVDEAADGVEITITKYGAPVATLRGAEPQKLTGPNTLRKRIRPLGGFSDDKTNITKSEWMKYWRESDKYVAGLFDSGQTRKVAQSDPEKTGVRKPVKKSRHR